jgi:hypothetical protein
MSKTGKKKLAELALPVVAILFAWLFVVGATANNSQNQPKMQPILQKNGIDYD